MKITFIVLFFSLNINTKPAFYWLQTGRKIHLFQICCKDWAHSFRKMSDSETKPLLGGQQNKIFKLKDEKRNIHTTPETTSIKYEKLKGKPSPSPSHSPKHEVKNRLALHKPRSLFNLKNKK